MEKQMKKINKFSSMYKRNCDVFNPMIKKYAIKPKLHGTNVSIYVDPDEGLVQFRSKNRIVEDGGEDHMGLLHELRAYKEAILEHVREFTMVRTVFYGEWAGGSVQSGPEAICKLDDKKFFCFAKYVYGLGMFYGKTDLNEVNMGGYPRFYDLPVIKYMDIPFDLSCGIQDKVDWINNYVDKLEITDDYVKTTFGFDGIGEGIVGAPVWEEDHDNWFALAFKAKTEGHQVQRTKRPVQTRIQTPQELIEFADMFVTEARMRQCVNENNLSMSLTETQTVLSWMGQDIKAESEDELDAMEVEWKDASKVVNSKVVTLWKNFIAKNDVL